MASSRLVFGPALLFLLLSCAPGREEGPAAENRGEGRVAVHAADLPLSKVLGELARQTGVRVEDRRGVGDGRVTVAVDRATFWQALDAVADAAGAVPYFAAQQDGVSLVKRPEGWR